MNTDGGVLSRLVANGAERKDIARQSRNRSGAPVSNRLGTTHRAKPVGNRRSALVAASPRYVSALNQSFIKPQKYEARAVGTPASGLA